MILTVTKGNARVMLTIPNAHSAKAVRFYGMDLPLELIAGGTYWIGGDPNCGNSVTADKMVLVLPKKERPKPKGRPMRLKPRK